MTLKSKTVLWPSKSSPGSLFVPSLDPRNDAFIQPDKIFAFRWKHYLPLCGNTEQFFGFPWSFASKVQGQCRNTDNNGRDNTCRLHVGIPERKIKNIINLKRLHKKTKYRHLHHETRDIKTEKHLAGLFKPRHDFHLTLWLTKKFHPFSHLSKHCILMFLFFSFTFDLLQRFSSDKSGLLLFLPQLMIRKRKGKSKQHFLWRCACISLIRKTHPSSQSWAA